MERENRLVITGEVGGGRAGREVGVVIKGNTGMDPYDRTVLNFDHGERGTKLCM